MLFHVISCYCIFNGNVSLWYRLKPWHAWQYSGIRRIHSEPAVLPKTPLRLAEIESTWPKDLERFGKILVDKPWIFHRIFHPFPAGPPSSNPRPWQPMAKWQRIQNLRVLSHLSSATAAIPKLDSCQKKLVEKEKPIAYRNLETWFPKSFLISDQSGTNRTTSIGKHLFDSWPHCHRATT